MQNQNHGKWVQLIFHNFLANKDLLKMKLSGTNLRRNKIVLIYNISTKCVPLLHKKIPFAHFFAKGQRILEKYTTGRKYFIAISNKQMFISSDIGIFVTKNVVRNFVLEESFSF